MTRMSHDEQRARARRMPLWGRSHGPVILTRNPSHQDLGRINQAKILRFLPFWSDRVDGLRSLTEGNIGNEGIEEPEDWKGTRS
jgi:hypothetical protein